MFLNNTNKSKIIKYVLSCKKKDFNFSNTTNADQNSFALNFAILIFYLIGEDKFLKENKDILINNLINNLDLENFETGNINKFNLQLLTITLSSLKVLNFQDFHIFKSNKFIKDLIENKIKVNEFLNSYDCLNGKPSSGNMAMFLGIILIFINNDLKIDKTDEINCWIDLHLKKLNQNSFWGRHQNMTYSQLQNGYHQYEVFNFLDKENNLIKNISIQNILKLSDQIGQFSPVFGGDACHDYDAIYLLTLFKDKKKLIKPNLIQLRESLLKCFNNDGGFCENIYVNNKIKNFRSMLLHAFVYGEYSRKEKIIKYFSLFRYKNFFIQTQFDSNKRKWSDSSLFTTWFRLLSIAKIEVYLNLETNNKWQFINFPGIGYDKKI